MFMRETGKKGKRKEERREEEENEGKAKKSNGFPLFELDILLVL